MSALLEIRDLEKRFPIRKSGSAAATVKRLIARTAAAPASFLHAVDGVNLSIGAGETVGLVGESGCGKSTLVRLITRLLDPSAGSIRFQDKELGTMPAHGFGARPERALIQMVFQDATDSLNPRYTGFDAIADPLRRLKGLSGTALKARVEECAELTGLPATLLSRFPHQLSGGQKARVGIARAIAVEPALLILDEPTAALDVSVQVIILRLLDDLKRRLGMSYLFVSHDLNTVRLLCDRVLVMYLGKIVESGPAEDVFARPAHPYTKALLSAIPNFEPGSTIARIRISGEPRSPIDPDPNVCRFYGRCAKGVERCTKEMPQLRTLPHSRAVACHFPEGGSGE
jgi:oligopeptide/dipeptide ABC transporter ATP-binding protein